MKKLINLSLIYAVTAMIGGVFFREFTKFNGFTDVTTLGKIHTHFFVLGMFFFLILALFEHQLQISTHKNFKKFMGIYNTGLVIADVTMLVRGVTQVLATPLSKGLSAALSGIAGMGHILLGVGIVMVLLILKSKAKD